MFRQLDNSPLKFDKNSRVNPSRFLAPDSAPLAQALLGVILDNSRLETFSPNGGGVMVMRLERWQIDILTGHGIVFEEESSSVHSVIDQLSIPTLNHRREYISASKDHSCSSSQSIDEIDKVFQQGDILQEWL